MGHEGKDGNEDDHVDIWCSPWERQTVQRSTVFRRLGIEAIGDVMGSVILRWHGLDCKLAKAMLIGNNMFQIGGVGDGSFQIRLLAMAVDPRDVLDHLKFRSIAFSRRWMLADLCNFYAGPRHKPKPHIWLCYWSMCRSRVSLAVDSDEIKRLGKRFKKLDLDNSGALSVDEFMSLPELQQNPLVQRVIDIFDTDGNGEVDFKGKYHNYA